MIYKLVTVKAPGKIILHGEHAVVYGKKAIAGAIDGYVKVSIIVSMIRYIPWVYSFLHGTNFHTPFFDKNQCLL